MLLAQLSGFHIAHETAVPDAERAEAFTIVEEPAGFSLHVLLDGRLVSHVQPL